MAKSLSTLVLGFVVALAATVAPTAAQTVAYPTLPGTSVRDYSKPGSRVDGNAIYPTLPGTNVRDYSKPGAVVRGDMVYPTLPGTSVRDYSKPGIRIK